MAIKRTFVSNQIVFGLPQKSDDYRYILYGNQGLLRIRAILLIVALLFCGYAWSEQPEKLSKPLAKEQLIKGNPHKDASGEPLSSIKSEPIVNSAVFEGVKPVDTNNEQPKTTAPEKNWFDKFCEDPVATFTGLLFAATVFLWLATRDLVKGAEKTSKQQLRAYVSIGNPHFDGIKNTLSIPLHNTGQTPAHKVCGQNNWQEIPIDGDLPEGFNYPDMGEKLTGPFKSKFTLGANKDKELTFNLPIEHLQRVHNKEIETFFYGHIDYFDIFDDSNTSTFCYRYTGTPGPDGDGRILRKMMLYKDHNDET